MENRNALCWDRALAPPPEPSSSTSPPLSSKNVLFTALSQSLLEDHSQTRLLNNGLTRQLCTALTLLKLLKMDGSLGWKMWLYTYWHSMCSNDLLRQNKFCHGLMRSFIIIIIIIIIIIMADDDKC
jgi:hypothetical protein